MQFFQEKSGTGKRPPARFRACVGVSCSACVLVAFAASSGGVLTAFADDSPPTFSDIGESADWLYGLYDDSADMYTLFGAPGAAVAAGMIMATYCLSNPIATGHVVDTSNVSCFSGMYYDASGKRRLACIAGSNTYGSDSSSSGGSLIFSGHDMEIYVTTSGGSDPVRCIIQSDDRYYSEIGTQNGALFLQNSKSGTVLQGATDQHSYQNFRLKHGGTIADIPVLGGTNLSSYFNCSYPPTVLACGVSFTLPTGELDPANPSGYVDSVLRPYIEQNYPDYVDLLPEPPPEPPQYETDDIVPGIPKSWTITNPYLPSIPTIDLPQLPTVDFENLPDTSGLSLTGASFWWALFDEILNFSGLKWLFLAVPVVGIAVFILWKLGD